MERKKQEAGIIKKIKMENFMCHTSLQIDLGDSVNFITGQNGSGKSAILTALLIAFGCRAKGTQRASTLKDFIKTGCSYAIVSVEIKNRGEDAFKPDVYGDVIIIERRISESSSSTTIKNYQGKKISGRKDDLRELVEHFNIEVENPCVIMSQDKSREFLHSGNDRDKFKFFFKATLLHQVDELLKGIKSQLDDLNEWVDELESTIRPIQKELADLQLKIKNMEHVEEISLQAHILKKKLAWSWVHDVDRQLDEQNSRIELLESREPKCQERIDRQTGSLAKLEEFNDHLNKKKAQISSMMESTSKVRRMKDELQQALTQAMTERLELQEVYDRKWSAIEKITHRLESLEKQSQIVHEQHLRSTQAEESENEERLKELQEEYHAIDSTLSSLKKEEEALHEAIMKQREEIATIRREIESCEKNNRDINSQIHDLRLNQRNKVTAFGGSRVITLVKIIERHQHRFKRPPIGPIGAHVTLLQGDIWALAVEHAVGKLLDAFIVTDHKDLVLLKGCAKEANYNHLQIIIYDFSRPRLHIPANMLPQTQHPTAISVIHSDNPTVMNVLVDIGNAERQVLVRTYDIGKTVAFDQRIPNLKEVYTLEGVKMFSRGSAETTLPPNKRLKIRLCGSYDNQINNLERDSSNAQEQAEERRGKKRTAEEGLQELGVKLENVKRLCRETERDATRKKFEIRDTKDKLMAETRSSPASSVDQLRYEISKLQDDIQEKKMSMEKIHAKLKDAEAKAGDLKMSFENLCESAKGEIDAFEAAERELMHIEEDLQSAEENKSHYEKIMAEKVLPEIQEAKAQFEELKRIRTESYKKASVICPENEVEALGGTEGNTPDQLSAQLTRLTQRFQRESERFTESIEDLKMLYDKKERKIFRKQQMYAAFREKLSASRKALDFRWSKFQRSATLLKRQLTWQFNGHLRKKGISGHVKVSYEEETLSIEVKMPQDASNNNVRDTRGLSGGERSFSTLCFALALHEMTEAPFRAMDEFDVFMDAVSRKISLDTLVEFALAQGSQWIFITPHDISMVKQGDRVRKQQMAAPRS